MTGCHKSYNTLPLPYMTSMISKKQICFCCLSSFESPGPASSEGERWLHKIGFNRLTFHTAKCQGWDSPILKLCYLWCWLELFQWKNLLGEINVIVEVGESQPWIFFHAEAHFFLPKKNSFYTCATWFLQKCPYIRTCHLTESNCSSNSFAEWKGSL